MKNNEKIKKLVGEGQYISFPKIFVEVSGGYNTASVLNQIVFWSDRTKRSDGYFYKTDKELAEETALSVYQVRKAVKELIKKGFIETKKKRANGAPTIHYFVDMEAINLAINGFVRNSQMEMLETNKSEYKKLQNGNVRNLQMDLLETNKSLTDDYTDDYTDDKDTIDSDFEKLWKLYPNKKGKPKAFASYKKAIKDGVTNKAIQDGIVAYSNYIDVNRTDKQFIKHGSTFFNNRAWEDDYTILDTDNHSVTATKPVLGFTEDAPSNPSEVVYSDETLKFASEQIDKGEFTPKAEDIPKINDWRKRNGIKELILNAENK